MASKNKNIGGRRAKKGNKGEEIDRENIVDAFEKVLWSDSPEEEYLKQWVIANGVKDSEDDRKMQHQAKDRIDRDETEKIKNENKNKNEKNSGSLEQIIRLSKADSRRNSYRRTPAENGRDGSENKTSHSGKKEHEHEHEHENLTHSDRDRRAVDKLIEASERELETELNSILDRDLTTSSLDAIPSYHLAAKASNKSVESHSHRQHREENPPLPAAPTRNPGSLGIGTSFLNLMNHDNDNDNESLAGDETVGNIVARIMEEDPDHTLSDSGLDTRGESWDPAPETETDGIAGGHPNRGMELRTQRFVTDETSVGSIYNEIDLVFAKHRRRTGEDDDDDDEEQLHDDGTLGPHTLVSTLSGDDYDAHGARVRAMLGGASGYPETTEGEESAEKSSNSNGNGNLIDKKPYRLGIKTLWWGQGRTTKQKQQQQQQQPPKTPSRSVDGSRSPQNSVAKTKDAPGTPSTVLIGRNPLGLASPPSDREPGEEPIADYSYSGSEEYDGRYGDYDYDDGDDKQTFRPGHWDPRQWDPFAYCPAGDDDSRFYKWIMLGIALLLALFVILIIILVAELGRPPSGPSQVQWPPTQSPVAKEDTPSFPETIVDWVSNSPPIKVGIPDRPTKDEQDSSFETLTTPTASPTTLVTDAASVVENRLREIVGARLPEKLANLEDAMSPQYRALEWVKSNPPSFEEMNNLPWKLRQKYVLAVLYYSTDGMNWDDNTGWLTPGSNECDWFSTTASGDFSACDDAGKFAEINLRLNNLRGTIPSEIVLIADQLNSITINGNSLSGTIPSILGTELTILKRFHAHWNSLTGSIPTQLNGMSSLASLKLGKNELVGSIPWQLSNLSKLKSLELFSNNLSGVIPFLLGDLTALTNLNLSNNNISGEIPVEIANLTTLKSLKLGRNNLEGTMPDEVCWNLPALESAEVDCEKVACSCCDGCK